jgi:hypothetical protein
LQCEQREQAERDAIEKRTIALLERCVEQMSYDLREREADTGRDDEADGRNRQAAAIRLQSREKFAEGFGRAKLSRARSTARGGGTTTVGR